MRPEALKVYFEVTNHCNFRCDFCPIDESRRKTQHMDYVLFQKGVDEVAREAIADTIGFHVLGEPLLYPRIFDAVAYAKSNGLQTELHTNGSLLTTERVDGLVRAGLDSLVISVQVIGQQGHASRGTRLPFDRYYRGVMDAVRRITQFSSATEVTLCMMNAATQKFFDVDKLIRMNGQRSSFSHSVASVVTDLRAAIGIETTREQVETALRKVNLNHPTYIRIREHLAVYAQPFADWGNAFTSRRVYPAMVGYCGYALSNVAVLNNGEVTICCADYDGHTSLGNLNAEPLTSMLASEKARAIREGFNRMQIVDPYCQRCIGSPHPVKAVVKGLLSIYLFKLLKFQPGGRIKEVPLILPPRQEGAALGKEGKARRRAGAIS
jgi:radical SAM protein with 4Fe4S-binding SPASM domain